MGLHLLGYVATDEDGWVSYVCSCGHRSGTFPSVDELVVSFEEHRSTVDVGRRCRVRR